MKPILSLALLVILISCNFSEKKVIIDESKHIGLTELKTNQPYKILYSKDYIKEARRQAKLISEAYLFLSEILEPKEGFCLLVISNKDWKKNAYSPISGMPEYYKGNLIVGAGQNSLATNYEEMIQNFPKELTKELISTYSNDFGVLDMKLFFDKLSVHELTHNFQDPKNAEGFSMSRWLEELHANMGLYAFYKFKRPNELKYVTSLVDFSLNNPPPNVKYSSLSDFDQHYYEISPSNYGYYQMKFTKAGQMLIDSLGKDILKPLNDFLIKYDDSWKGKVTEEEFKKKLANEVDPYITEIIDSLSLQNFGFKLN